MFCIVLIQEGRGDVRNIAARITFSSNIYFEVLDPKDLLPVLEKLHKVFGNLLLGRGGWDTQRESRSHGLVNPIKTN